MCKDEKKQDGFETATEMKLYEIWANVLDRQDISPFDDFYDLGGTSFQAFTILIRIKEAFGIEIHLMHILEDVSIKKLAALIDTKLADKGL